jgi:hypothetical protein
MAESLDHYPIDRIVRTDLVFDQSALIGGVEPHINFSVLWINNKSKAFETDSVLVRVQEVPSIGLCRRWQSTKI